MELFNAIHKAAELTEQVIEELEAGNMADIDSLLEQRGRSLAALEEAHHRASAQEQSDCLAGLKELQKADRRLQAGSLKMLETVGAEFRDQLGMPRHGQQKSGLDPVQGCVDRKA